MSDNDVELKASVSFEVDGAKAAAAQKAVQGIKASAESAGEAIKKVKPDPSTEKDLMKMGGSAEKTFQAVNAAAAAAEGNVMGVGRAVAALGFGFPKLMAALGPIGLIVGAFSVLQGIIQKVHDARDKLEAGLRAMKMTALENQIQRTTEAYDKQREAIDRVADARQRLSDVEQAKDDAHLRAQLAELELAQAQEKAMLSPDDSIGARKVDLSYSEKRASLEEASAQRKSERDTTQIAASLSDLLDKRNNAIREIETVRKLYGRLSERQTDITSKMGGAVFGIGGMTSEEADPELKNIDKVRESLMARMKAAVKQRDDVVTPILELKGLREVADVDRQTLGTKRNKRLTDDYMTGTGIDRDQNAQVDAMFQDLNAVTADGSAVFRNWARDQIAAKERENALTAQFMQQMIDLATANAKQIQDSAARARRL